MTFEEKFIESCNADMFADFQPFEKERALPPFPVESLPAVVGEYVKAVSVFTQTPPEMSGVLALSVLAGCCQKGFTVHVRGDWFEPLCIYVLVIADPAERKSAVYKLMLIPVYDFVKLYNAENAVELAKSKSMQKILDDTIAALEKAVANGKKTYDDLEIAIREKADFKPINPLKLTIDDCTPEKLIDIASEGNYSLLLCSSEGDFVEYVSKGRYDSSANLGVYLKAFDGETVQLDRIKRGSQTVDKLLLSTALCCQPSALSDFMADPKASGRGLCARFLYSVCKGNIGERVTEPPEIPENIKQAYYDLITSLLDMSINVTETQYLRLSTEADKTRRLFQEDTERRLVNDLVGFQDWSGKLVGRSARLAGIFHVCDCVQNNVNPADVPISENTLLSAINIAGFLTEHARAAYSQGDDEKIINAKYLWKRLNSLNSLKISKSEIIRRVQNKRGFSLDESLIELQNRGYIRIEYNRPESSIGRTAETIYINETAKKSE